MTLQQLYYFQMIAQLQHYNRAASELNVSQPSLSKAMSILEEELGIPLFEKRGRNVVLTKYGSLFLQHVNTILQEKENAELEIKKLLDRHTGHIDIGYVAPLSTHYIPKTVRSFLNQDFSSNVTFSFTQGITDQMLNGLKTGEFDVSFGSYSAVEPRFTFIPILKEQLVVIVPPDHPLSDHPALSLEAIEPFPCISYDHYSAMGKYTRKTFKAHNMQMQFVCEAAEEMAICALVAEGFGVSYVAQTEEIKEQARKRKIQILHVTNEEKYRILYMIYDDKRYHIPAVQNFITFVKSSTNYLPPVIS